ncbi:hypothetical protein Y1Q_0016693 [Alligator mississippiensis]|uniref:G-protein coupled receptors family 1 profile domain-containing protein n=1 Tax=Alligator mississippiensis TaxID=8496 RepID=A0A151P641_ALLMI|nr:hypothetical protein Y1Q_0016693 [Alligator mississippiensis]
MSAHNHSSQNPVTCILTGIPGLEESHIWISIPFCSVYVVVVLGNGLVEALLHLDDKQDDAMYLFLCLLALADLMLSTTTVPKMLVIF